MKFKNNKIMIALIAFIVVAIMIIACILLFKNSNNSKILIMRYGNLVDKAWTQEIGENDQTLLKNIESKSNYTITNAVNDGNDHYTLTASVTSPDICQALKDYQKSLNKKTDQTEMNNKLNEIINNSALKTTEQTITILCTDDGSEKVEFSDGFIDAMYGYAYSYAIELYSNDTIINKNQESTTTDSNSITTTSKAEAVSVDNALIELIYNSPKYGMKMESGNVEIEIVDINNDEFPEVIFCNYLGATGVPQIVNIFYFNGSQYVAGNTSKLSDCAYYPVLPMKDNKNNICFLSKLNTSSDDDDTYYIPMYWHYWAAGVAKFSFDGENLTSEDIKDYGKFCKDLTGTSDLSEVDKQKEIAEYKKQLDEFHKEYKNADSYKYLTTYVDLESESDNINSKLSKQKKLDIYHSVMTKKIAKTIVEKYNENSTHSFDLADQ